ncbi:MOSC domain-containing protein [Streptomyces sp. TRM43335]|uniref:MOSC domain-containing protein n=1 Tax=Streptomyces taklimakanensis TaxID=2569853 RepID=A0A6G2BI79_9ACTN|nr:MOSC N-terminal beta barrel domain-containing protein [Streptomyces taklimakanensis]MTE21997.1 MOSC domain-containing protein [Streptomyces taklimakanensis]
MTTSTLASLNLYPVKSLAGVGTTRAVVEPWGLSGDRRWMVAGPGGVQLTQREHPRMALAAAGWTPGGGLRLSAPGMRPLTVEVPDPSSEPPTVVEVWRTKVEVVPAAEEAHAWLTEYLGTEARLVHLDEPDRGRPIATPYGLPGETVSLADGFPVLLTTASSLDALNLLIEQGDHPDEGPLPMNRFRPNVVVEGTPPWSEDAWRRVRIGEVSFRVAKPCGRCVVTTTDQSTGERGKEPLRTLARHRRFGDRLVFGQNLVPENTGVLRTGDVFEVLE